MLTAVTDRSQALLGPYREPLSGDVLSGGLWNILRTFRLAWLSWGGGSSSVAANDPRTQRQHGQVKKKQDLWYEPEMSLQTGSGGLGSPQQLDKIEVVSSGKWFHNAVCAV